MAEAAAASAELSEAGRWVSLKDVYVAQIRTAMQFNLQYRANVAIDLLLVTIEPIVYLAVWQLVASRRRRVDGFTTGRFAAYYITFGLVRLVMQSGHPGNWQRAVQRGDSPVSCCCRCTRPRRHGAWAGFGLFRAITWLPIGAVLVLVYRPDFDTSPLQVAAFVASLVPAFVMRTLLNDVIGMVSFWFVSIAAVNSIVGVVETLLSGRLVPPELMPGWAQAVSRVLPFEWAFAFPIKVLIGPIAGGEIAQFAIQLVWVAAIWLVMQFVWQRGRAPLRAVSG